MSKKFLSELADVPEQGKLNSPLNRHHIYIDVECVNTSVGTTRNASS
jgi:hypothetical protein